MRGDGFEERKRKKKNVNDGRRGGCGVSKRGWPRDGGKKGGAGLGLACGYIYASSTAGLFYFMNRNISRDNWTRGAVTAKLSAYGGRAYRVPPCHTIPNRTTPRRYHHCHHHARTSARTNEKKTHARTHVPSDTMRATEREEEEEEDASPIHSNAGRMRCNSVALFLGGGGGGHAEIFLFSRRDSGLAKSPASGVPDVYKGVPVCTG